MTVPQPSEPATPAVPEAPVVPAQPDPGTPPQPAEPAITPQRDRTDERELEGWVRNRWHDLVRQAGLRYQ
jgi:hypothetical protein